jgi:hypothetical protein
MRSWNLIPDMKLPVGEVACRFLPRPAIVGDPPWDMDEFSWYATEFVLEKRRLRPL